MSTGDARIGAAAGIVAVVGNVAAVAFLYRMPSAYRLARLDEWVLAVNEQRAATTASTIAFVIGLVALAWWARHRGARAGSAAARAGAWLIAVTALFDALGTVAPFVQSSLVASRAPEALMVGRALLGMSLSLDAVFNFGMGLGLLMVGVSQRGALRVVMIAAGLANLPVSAQAVWDPAATGLYVSAPLWLTAIVWTSIRDMREASLAPRTA